MRLKGKRTMIFAIAAAVLPAADALRETLRFLLSLPEIGDIIPVQYYPYYTMGVAIGTMILRVMTTTPVGRDE